MNSHGSTECNEGYPWNKRLHALPRSGRPIVSRTHDDNPAKHPIRRLAPIGLPLRGRFPSADYHG
jgi:hypothetical protein